MMCAPGSRSSKVWIPASRETAVATGKACTSVPASRETVVATGKACTSVLDPSLLILAHISTGLELKQKLSWLVSWLVG